MKKVTLLVLSMLMIAALCVGCGGSAQAEAETEAESAVEQSSISSGLTDIDLGMEEIEEPKATGEGISIGFVSTGVLGDKALTDTTWAGLNKLKEDYPDIEIKVYESPNGSTDWEPNILAATEAHDLIIVNASSCGDILRRVAEANPDKYYVANEVTIKDLDNVASDVYCCNEVAFLLGAMAGLMTQDTSIPGINEEHIVGYISGMESPTTMDYFVGFEAGAKYTCPDVTVLDAWTGSYTDPLLSKEMTKGMISQGADLVLGCISSAVVGVFEACQEAGVYSFGLDTNKDADYLGTIVTSGLKCGDVTSYMFGQAFIEGTWEPGFTLMDVASGAMDVTDMTTIREYLNLPVMDDYYEQVIEIRDEIKAGNIEIPYVPAARGEE